jgi:hypothetical protein
MQKTVGLRTSRAVERLISSAIDYCRADAIVIAAQAQFAELARNHDSYNAICCIPPPQTDFDSDPPEALPESEWCEYCRKYAGEAIDGESAKVSRRAARQRMRRAYRQIIAGRAPLADTILALYRKGHITQRFSASEVEHLLVGIFSDDEIRSGLAGIVGRHRATTADKRFRELEKYRFEIID